MVNIQIFLLSNFVAYFLVHIPLDFKMRAKSKERTIKNHGFDVFTPDQQKLSLFSISMWLVWFTFCFESVPHLFRNVPLLLFAPYKILLISALVVMELAVLLAIWTRITRGINSPSWGVYEDMRIITSGPYQFVRHPSYLFYILTFLTLPIITGFTPSIINIIGIKYYLHQIEVEEQMMIQHFGESYRDYQKNVGKLFPKD